MVPPTLATCLTLGEEAVTYFKIRRQAVSVPSKIRAVFTNFPGIESAKIRQ